MRLRRLTFLGMGAWVVAAGAACESPGDNAAARDAAISDVAGPREGIVEGDILRPFDALPDSDGSIVPAGEAIDTVVGGFDTYRAQIADIVPLGDDDFVVGYRDAQDRLKVVRWGSAGQQGPPEVSAEGARWVRADTSEGFVQANTFCASSGVVHANTLAVEYGGDAPMVRLDIHFDCDGRKTMSSVPVAAGVRPASVTLPPGGAATAARTLIVYGRQSMLLGRIATHAAPAGNPPIGQATLGAEFPITRFTLGGAFSTDVIYNRHSDRFIVGYIQRGGFGCSTWNVVLDASADPPVVVAGPTQFGVCDGDQGGHHTSVAYNPMGDGTYAWWRQDMNLVKSVFIHDSSGAATSPVGLVTANVLEFGNIWTTPVTGTRRGELAYLALFGEPETHLFGMDGAGAWTDRLPHFGPAVQVAVRALPNVVVGLMRVLDDDHFGTSTLRLVRVPLEQVP